MKEYSGRAGRWMPLADSFLRRIIFSPYYSCFFLFLLYQSRKDCLGASGISRCLYHGLNLLLITNGKYFINHLPRAPATLKIFGFDKTALIPLMAIFLPPVA